MLQVRMNKTVAVLGKALLITMDIKYLMFISTYST